MAEDLLEDSVDIDLIDRKINDLFNNLMPQLLQRVHALERTIGAQQRQLSDLINLAPDKQSKSEAAAEARAEKSEAAAEARAEKK